jgi:hypothetical protein
MENLQSWIPYSRSLSLQLDSFQFPIEFPSISLPYALVLDSNSVEIFGTIQIAFVVVFEDIAILDEF